jgi:hypothetical protein
MHRCLRSRAVRMRRESRAVIARLNRPDDQICTTEGASKCLSHLLEIGGPRWRRIRSPAEMVSARHTPRGATQIQNKANRDEREPRRRAENKLYPRARNENPAQFFDAT